MTDASRRVSPRRGQMVGSLFRHLFFLLSDEKQEEATNSQCIVVAQCNANKQPKLDESRTVLHHARWLCKLPFLWCDKIQQRGVADVCWPFNMSKECVEDNRSSSKPRCASIVRQRIVQMFWLGHKPNNALLGKQSLPQELAQELSSIYPAWHH